MKCLIIDRMHESIIPGLEHLGLNVDYLPDTTREDLLAMISDYQGLVVRSKTNIDKEVLDTATRLKFVARAGAGIELVDIRELKRRGIPLFNAPEGNRDALAEHAIGMLLAILQKIVRGNTSVRSRTWDREGHRGYELMGKTVALIGYGYMGSAFARRLRAFGCNVLAYDKYKRGFSNEFCQEASMNEIYMHADIVSFHVPLTPETDQLINKKYLQQFKKDIILLNTARGGIMCTGDVIEMLESGKIRAAGLDVLENEKLKTWSEKDYNDFERLSKHPDVIFTPHVGGWTYESYEKINQVLIRKIKHFILKKS